MTPRDEVMAELDRMRSQVVGMTGVSRRAGDLIVAVRRMGRDLTYGECVQLSAMLAVAAEQALLARNSLDSESPASGSGSGSQRLGWLRRLLLRKR